MLFIGAAAGAAVGGVASEHAPSVFHDVPSVPPNALVEAEHAIRQRVAGVDLERFGEIRRRVLDGVPAGMALNLWEGAEFEALISRTERTSAGYTLSGRLAGVRHGAATLVVNGDVVAGTVWTPTALYDIRTVNGLQVLREVDVASLPPLAPPLARGHLPGGRSGTGTVRPQSDSDASDDGAVVELLVLWTARAAKKAGGVAGIRALIDLGVAAANDAYARSGVHFRLSLVGAEQTDYPDFDELNLSSDVYEEVDRRTEDILAVRDRVGADLTSIVVDGLAGFGGFAIMMHELSLDFANEAFSFVDVDRVAYNTLAHEIGHNMGVHHDRYVAPEGGVFPYSHGYVNQRALDPGAPRDACWATIMAYLSQCFEFGGHRLAVRIPYFSNPNLRYPAPDGDPLGVDESSTFTDRRGPANVVASLNKARHVVANFRRSLGDRGGATDHGDTPTEATPVSVGSITRGLLELEDVDYFRIDVPRTGTLRIETTGATDTRGELASADRDGRLPRRSGRQRRRGRQLPDRTTAEGRRLRRRSARRRRRTRAVPTARGLGLAAPRRSRRFGATGHARGGTVFHRRHLGNRRCRLLPLRLGRGGDAARGERRQRGRLRHALLAGWASGAGRRRQRPR